MVPQCRLFTEMPPKERRQESRLLEARKNKERTNPELQGTRVGGGDRGRSRRQVAAGNERLPLLWLVKSLVPKRECCVTASVPLGTAGGAASSLALQSRLWQCLSWRDTFLTAFRHRVSAKKIPLSVSSVVPKFFFSIRTSVQAQCVMSCSHARLGECLLGDVVLIDGDLLGLWTWILLLSLRVLVPVPASANFG